MSRLSKRRITAPGIQAGPADYATAQQLHRALAADLLARVPTSPPADLLGVARGFLRNCGLAGQPQTRRDRARLQKLYGQYVKALEGALAENPSAAILAEVGRFLHSQGVGKDLGALLDKAQAVEVLSLASLPFKGPVQ